MQTTRESNNESSATGWNTVHRDGHRLEMAKFLVRSARRVTRANVGMERSGVIVVEARTAT